MTTSKLVIVTGVIDMYADGEVAPMAPNDGDGPSLGSISDPDHPSLGGTGDGDAPLGSAPGDDGELGVSPGGPDVGLESPPDCGLPPGDDLPHFETLPGEVTVYPPPESDEIRIALERARQVAEDLRQVLQPAQQMMREGAWESRSADQFSLELEENARHCTMVGQRGVEAIEELSRRGPPGDGLEFMPLYAQGS